MSISEKVAMDLALALNPENIKACALARAEGLKLTEPEQIKRNEAVAQIDGAVQKLKELEDAKIAHENRKEEIAKSLALIDEKNITISEKAQANDKLLQVVSAREAAVKQKEIELDGWKKNLDALAIKLNAQADDLAKRQAAIEEQEANIVNAQQLVLKKKNV